MHSGASPPGRCALLVHGGAWDIPDAEVAAHAEAVRAAVARGRALLERGRAALDVAEDVVAALESDPALNAGRGAVLDRDGAVQLDAGIMASEGLRWGAVAHLRQVPNPVRVARRLLDGDGAARLLVAEGAERFAAACGLPLVEPAQLVVPREVDRLLGAEPAPQGTVGCVVLDVRGGLAAATSTGGTPGAPPGRVGDVPLVGAGFWADDGAAVSSTGWGEPIATVQLAASVARQIDHAVRPDDAATEELSRMHRRIRWAAGPATGGVIALGASGLGGWAFSTPRMARGGWSDGAEPWCAVDP